MGKSIALNFRLDTREITSDNLWLLCQSFTIQSRLLTTLSKRPFEKIVGKGENAGNQHFLLFPQCFQPYQRQITPFKLIFIFFFTERNDVSYHLYFFLDYLRPNVFGFKKVEVLLKIWWGKKKKMLLTSIFFFFPPTVFSSL